MGKVILLCGKICSGKTRYAKALCAGGNAVPLSCDALMTALLHHREGERFDEIARDAKAYLHDRAADIAKAGIDVLLDWGFWTQAEREDVSAFYAARGIETQWHYIDVSDAQWRRNIDRRNADVRADRTQDYAVDEGLLAKLEERFEVPDRSQMDVWIQMG